MPSGALAHFGFAQEATPGTRIDPVTAFIDPTSADIDDKFPREAIATMREDRAQVRSISKITEVALSMESPLYYNVLPWFFKFGLGAVPTTTAAGTGYQHVFNGAKILPSFSAEVAYDTAGAKQGYGFKVNTFNIKANAGEHATFNLEAIGIGSAKDTAATAVLPADDNLAVFSHASVTFNAVANNEIITCDLGIDNGLESIKTLNGTSFVQRINEGPRKITAGLDMDFTSQAMYDLSIAATKVAILLTFTSTVLAGGQGHPYSMIVSLPNTKFSSVSAPVSADGVISQKVDTVVLYDGTASHDMRITVVNTDTAYANPS